MYKVLFIDRKTKQIDALRDLLAPEFLLQSSADFDEGLERLKTQGIDCVVVDLDSVDPAWGVRPLARLARLSPASAIIVTQATLEPRAVLPWLEAGVASFYAQPYEADRLADALRYGLAVQLSGGRMRPFPIRSPSPPWARPANEAGGDELPPMIGLSEPMRKVRVTLACYAAADECVLIRGETGTGKDLAAYEIHRASSRREGPFRSINCAAIAETLADSELFGTTKGAFTGAVDKPGLFEAARGGTLFLDEVGELSLPIQAKLLRAIENKEGVRVGSMKTIRYDVRLICATNAPLTPPGFRQDLFHRISVLPIAMPPLRARDGDVELLAREFLRQEAPGARLSAEAVEELKARPWFGNVRELKNCIKRAAILSFGATAIGRDELRDCMDAADGVGQKYLG